MNHGAGSYSPLITWADIMFKKQREKYIQNLLDQIEKEKQKNSALEQRVKDLIETNLDLREQITKLREQSEINRANFDELASKMKENVAESNALKIRYEIAIREAERLKTDYKKRMDELFDSIGNDGGD